jgi:hypothetical protein
MIQSAGDQAFFLILVIACLGASFVWALWEIEEARRRQKHNREIVQKARRSVIAQTDSQSAVDSRRALGLSIPDHPASPPPALP